MERAKLCAMKWGDWTAVYGALLSTVLAVAQAFRWYTERARVRINVGLRTARDMVSGAAIGPDLLWVSVINLGLQDVTITHFGWALAKREGVFMHDGKPQTPPFVVPSFPWSLKAHNRVDFALPMKAFPEDCRGYFVIDTLDRRWRTTRRDFRKLKKQRASEPEG